MHLIFISKNFHHRFGTVSFYMNHLSPWSIHPIFHLPLPIQILSQTILHPLSYSLVSFMLQFFNKRSINSFILVLIPDFICFPDNSNIKSYSIPVPIEIHFAQQSYQIKSQPPSHILSQIPCSYIQVQSWNYYTKYQFLSHLNPFYSCFL